MDGRASWLATALSGLSSTRIEGAMGKGHLMGLNAQQWLSCIGSLIAF